MDYKERQLLVRRICSGKLFGTVRFNNDYYNVTFIDPTLDILYQADSIYKTKLEEHKKNGIFTLEESYDILTKNGTWTTSLEIKLEKLKSDIEDIKARLPTLKFQKYQQRVLSNTLEDSKKQYSDILSIKNSLWPHTAEHLAEKSKRRFVISSIVRCVDDKLLKKTPFLDCLCIYYYDENAVAEKDIRELARTNPWRLHWTVSKETGSSLFPHSSVEMTELQSALVNWTIIYDSAYQSTNRPSDDIINDDDQFDMWYENEAKRAEKESQSNTDQYGKGQEVFIMADAEGAKDVYTMNNKEARDRIRSRQAAIEKKGVIAEQDLPDVKRDLMMMANRSKNG